MIWVIAIIIGFSVLVLALSVENDLTRRDQPAKHPFPDILVHRIANFKRYDGVEMEREGMDWEEDATCTLNDLIDECREYLKEERQ